MKWRFVPAVAACVSIGYVAGRLGSRSPLRPREGGIVPPPPLPSIVETQSNGSPSRVRTAELDLVHLELRLRAIKPLHDWKRSSGLAELVRNVPIRYIPEAIRLGDGILERNDWPSFQRALFERWTDADPRAVLLYGTTPPRSPHSDEAAELGAAEWARRDPTAALDWAAKLPAGTSRNGLLQNILKAVAEADPQGALKSLELLPPGQRTAAREEILVQLARRSPTEALDAAHKQTHGVMRPDNVEMRILAVWLDQDADAAGSWIKTIAGDKGRLNTAVAAISNFGQDHPAEALKLAAGLPAGIPRNNAFTQILQNCDDLGVLKAWTETQGDPQYKALGQMAYARVLAETDPATAAASLAGLQLSGQNAYQASQIFEQYSAVSPDAAVQLAAGIQNTELRKQAMIGALGGWSERDPAAAANYAAGLPASQDRNQILQTVARNWADQDPNAFFDWLKTGAGSAIPKKSAMQLLDSAAEFAPAQTADLALSLGGNPSEMARFASLWAQRDPEAALEWAAALPDTKSRDQVLSQAISQTAANDPAQAIEYAKQLSPGSMQASAMGAIAASLAESDLAEAQRFVDGLPEGEGRDSATGSLLQSWAQTSPEAALAYAEKLPEGSPSREEGLGTVLRTLATHDPDAALAYLGKMGTGDQTQAAIGAIQTVVENDPSKASAWLTALPEGGLKQLAGDQLMSAWAAEDPAAAQEWLKTLPAGEFHDRTAREFALRAAQSAPQLAWAWALAFPEMNDPSSPVRYVADKWIEDDPGAAAAAIRNSGLPEAFINELLNKAH